MWLEWFVKSIALWRRLDEEEYRCKPRLGVEGENGDGAGEQTRSGTRTPVVQERIGLGLDTASSVDGGDGSLEGRGEGVVVGNGHGPADGDGGAGVDGDGGADADESGSGERDRDDEESIQFEESDEALAGLAGDDFDDWLKDELGDDWGDGESERGR